MKTLKFFALLLTLTLAVTASAQIKIPNTGISITLPETGWKYLETAKIDNNTTLYLYSYSGDYVIDGTGDTILPFMRVFVRNNFKGTVYDLAYNRFLSQPFQSLDERVHENGALEYLGAYRNTQDGKDYEFRMLYIIDRTSIAEIRLETSVDTFDQFDEMFKGIIQSVKIAK